MSTNKREFTPGPWTITGFTATGERCIQVENDIQMIGEVYEADSDEETMANAKLFAASGDLLSALRRCLAYIERDEQRHGRQLNEGKAARTAIKKAIGDK